LQDKEPRINIGCSKDWHDPQNGPLTIYVAHDDLPGHIPGPYELVAYATIYSEDAHNPLLNTNDHDIVFNVAMRGSNPMYMRVDDPVHPPVWTSNIRSRAASVPLMIETPEVENGAANDDRGSLLYRLFSDEEVAAYDFRVAAADLPDEDKTDERQDDPDPEEWNYRAAENITNLLDKEVVESTKRIAMARLGVRHEGILRRIQNPTSPLRTRVEMEHPNPPPLMSNSSGVMSVHHRARDAPLIPNAEAALVGFYFSHDASIAVQRAGRVVLVLELERLFEMRYFKPSNDPSRFIAEARCPRLHPHSRSPFILPTFHFVRTHPRLIRDRTYI
jgi:hypothetical protein